MSNGFIAFGGSYTDCCGSKFPQSNIKIAPLWDDLVPGTIWYRQTTTDQTDLVVSDIYHAIHLKTQILLFDIHREMKLVKINSMQCKVANINFLSCIGYGILPDNSRMVP